MTDEPHSLILEHLRAIRSDIADIKTTLADHTHLLLRVREDINSLRGDDLRIESMQAQMAHRLERIEKRLALSDA